MKNNCICKFSIASLSVTMFVSAASGGAGTIILTGGSLAGQNLGPSAWEINVSAGATISGTVNCRTVNRMGANAVAPFGYTWTWGNRQSDIVEIDGWIPTGTQTWQVAFSQTAPTTPGTYYILFGFSGEFNMSQVLSCDNWNAGGSVVWNDGNDYFDLDAARIQFAQINGYVQDWPYRTGASTYTASDIPVMPIKVTVTSDSSAGLEFPVDSGYFWNVMASETPVNPGGNYWSDSTNVVWIDADGRLHLTIKYLNGKWYCSQLTSVQPAQYGTYRFYVDCRLDQLYDYAVLGMYLYRGYSETNIRELDIEFSKSPISFGGSARPLWFAVQNANGTHPAIASTNFAVSMSGTYSTHYIRWQGATAEFKGFHGHYSEPTVGEFGSFIAPASVASHIPQNNEPYVNLNFWLDNSDTTNVSPPDTTKTHEVIIADFDYQPWFGPAIKANGADENITIGYGEQVSIGILIFVSGQYSGARIEGSQPNGGGLDGIEADWWVVAIPGGGGEWYYLNATMQWSPFAAGNLAACQPAYQGPLMDITSPVTVLPAVTLPTGTYIFYFAVDQLDGVLNYPAGQILVDSVTITVQ